MWTTTSPFVIDARTLRNGDTFTFTTDFGDLDCIGTPTGTKGYEDLMSRAVEVIIDGNPVSVAAIDDLIAMKRAAGRPKDLARLPLLEALRDALAAASDQPGPAETST